MAADPKLIPVPLGVGMDQSVDEYMAPVGNLRRVVNARVRRGGSIEQRRGVHGIELGVPSYMADFRPTGSAQFVARLGESAYMGQDAQAYAIVRENSQALYAGQYSEYQPLKRRTAFLTERQHGLDGCRHTAVGRDVNGKEYVVFAAMSDTNIDCRVQDTAGKTLASFTIESGDAIQIELVASELAPYVYLLVRQATPSDQVVMVKIHLHKQISYTRHLITEISFGFPFVASPVPQGAFSIGLVATAPDLLMSQPGIDLVGVNLRSGDTSLLSGEVRTPSGAFRYIQSGSRAAIQVGNTPRSYTVFAATKDPSHPTGSVHFWALPQTFSNAATWSPIATGALLEPGQGGYSAPVLGVTPRDDRFIWAASNGRLTMGTLEIASGASRAETVATLTAVPLSQFDNRGSFWVTENIGEYAPVPRAGRALLMKHPAWQASGGAFRQPLVQLAAERQFPNPTKASFVWRTLQDTYSRIGVGSQKNSVLLPLQLRSQASGLFSLEQYDYQHFTQSQPRETVELGRSLVVAGQPIEVVPNPNRVGFGVFTGAPTFAARESLASEVGFPAEPHVATLTTASGANITPGTRLYTSIFEWLAPTGERHRSRPATPRPFVNDSNTGVLVHTPEQFLSQRFPPPRVHYYRTKSGQKQFHRISPDTGVEPGETFYDHATDSEITDNEILYTDGGVQPNDLAPSCRFMALGEDRLWLGGLFDGDILQSSKRFVPREPIQFSDHDAFKVRLPFNNTGIAYLDGALVAFCSDSTYLVTGEGPNNQGAGGYSLRPIADNVGCIDARSIVVTSKGVFFQSRRSLQLMPRGFGAPEEIRALNDLVGDIGDGFTEIIGAAVQESADEETVRFLLRNPTTDERIVACLELGTGTWSYDVITGGGGEVVEGLLTDAGAVLLVDFFRADGFNVTGADVDSIVNLITGDTIAHDGSAPQYSASAFGDHAGVDFDGTDDRFMITTASVVAALTSNQEFTAFLYIAYDSNSSVTTPLGAGRTDADEDSTVRIGNGGGAHRHITRDDGGTQLNAAVDTTQDTDPHLLTFRHSASGTRLYIDGVASDTGEVAIAPGTLTPERVCIGARGGQTPAFHFDGKMGLLALVPSALGDSERHAIEVAILEKVARAKGEAGPGAGSLPLASIADGPEGLMYGLGSGTHQFLVELEGAAGTPYDSMGSTVTRFHSEVHLSRMSPFNPGGEGKLKAVQIRGFAPATGAQVNLSMVTDHGTQTHTFSGIGSGTFYRRAVPAQQEASECQVSATFRAGVGRQHGLRLLHLVLEVEPQPGGRRPRIGEQE